MIEKITVDNCKLEDFKKSFPQFLLKTDIIKHFDNNSFTQLYVYIEKEEIMGFIMYDLIYERCELTQIEVKQEHRNRHIASELLTHMIEDCKKNRVENITLEVKQTNIPAINLYNKFGFKEVALRKGYYQGIDGILMEKEMI